MKLSWLTLAAMVAAARASAQTSPTVSPADPVYRDLRLFAAAGLLDTTIFGQLPLSARTISRMLS